MKKYCLTLLLFCLACLATAQEKLSKAEKKALEKEIAAFKKNPAAYEEFKKKYQTNKETVAKLDGQIADLNEAVNNGKTKLAEKEARVKEIVDEINRLKAEKNETDVVVKTTTDEKGTLFKVQVPIEEAYIYKEVSEVTGKPQPVFSGEEDQDGKKKYTLGYFKTKNEADTFCQYLKQLRIRDAIVVRYEDGKKQN